MDLYFDFMFWKALLRTFMRWKMRELTRGGRSVREVIRENIRES